MYRKETFDDKLSKKLTRPNFAKQYLLDCIKDGMSVMTALKHTISCMGTKEFSEMSGIKAPNISRMLSQEFIPKIDTLQKFLAPFQLEAHFILRASKSGKAVKKKKKGKNQGLKKKKARKSKAVKKVTRKKRSKRK